MLDELFTWAPFVFVPLFFGGAGAEVAVEFLAVENFDGRERSSSFDSSPGLCLMK